MAVGMFVMVALFALTFLVVLGIIVAVVVRGVAANRANNASPVVTVPAWLVAKRQAVVGGDRMTSTSYFVTFELDSGSRVEFLVDAPIYGQSAEGDFGSLSFQGTRFLWFQRQLGASPPTGLR